MRWTRQRYVAGTHVILLSSGANQISPMDITEIVTYNKA